MALIDRTLGATGKTLVYYVAFAVMRQGFLFAVFYGPCFLKAGHFSCITFPNPTVWAVVGPMLTLFPAYLAGAMVRRANRDSHVLAVMLGTGAGEVGFECLDIIMGRGLNLVLIALHQIAGAILGLAGYATMMPFTKRKKAVEKEELD